MLILRRYQKSDSDAVWELHNLALSHAGANAGNGPWDNDLHQVEEVYLQNGEFIVGLLDGRLIAMGALRRTSSVYAEIKRMRVHPDFQKQGFGQQILDYLEARAVELGFKTLHLDTTVQQVAAQKLYTRNGYREVDRKQWRGMTMIFYEKCL